MIAVEIAGAVGTATAAGRHRDDGKVSDIMLLLNICRCRDPLISPASHIDRGFCAIGEGLVDAFVALAVRAISESGAVAVFGEDCWLVEG